MYCQLRAAAPVQFVLHSPDNRLKITCRVNEGQAVMYQLQWQGTQVLDWSALGLEISGKALGNHIRQARKLKETEADHSFPWMYGEQDSIHNHYREMLLSFTESSGMSWLLRVRAYNESLAFRYEIPAVKSGNWWITAEKTAFHLAAKHQVYQHHTESVIRAVAADSLEAGTDFPAVLAAPQQFICINEARNIAYTKAMIVSDHDRPATLVLRFPKDSVPLTQDFLSPWRTVTLSTTAIGLCDQSDLLYKLCDPPPAGIAYDWVKPGKLIREMSLTTAGALSCIDFAKKMHLQYIMFDAGWYGKGYAAEHDPASDPRKVIPAIDIHRVVQYGKEQGIGLIVYINYVGLRKYNMDTTLALYQSWGIKGLKFGFVDGLSREGIRWLVQAVRKAQDMGFIVDVHDNYKPTGLSRTMPGWLTQEGVRGNENNPDAYHNTTLPFTRFLSGAADYTFCFRSQNDSFNHTLLDKKLQVSQAHQLALSVVFYSPLQSMFWYGRPAYYTDTVATEFFKYVPTVWSKTVHLKGEISRYMVVARKNGQNWYMGTVCGPRAIQTGMDLSFLDKDKYYSATIYTDNGSGGIRKTVQRVSSQTHWDLQVQAACGEAVIFRPVRE
ncbi:MAG TPA: glycoside hydrolase family 97 catalytic domain-containing protein [Sediminibacterium sp.]|nr:glycoside hydrolase family 97 catalytic domain-containing protein [Sediminibacterium sp.]